MKTIDWSKVNYELQRQVVHTLIQQQGLKEGEYALFFTTGEGEFLPVAPSGDLIEESSGFVLDKYNRHFSFWLGWDAEKESVGLTEWRETPPEAHWAQDQEYRRARQRVGLPVPPGAPSRPG